MSITENVAKQTTALLIKTHADQISEALFREGSLRSVLVEALDDKDKAEMKQAVDDFKGMASELINGLPKTPEWEEVVKPISDAAGTVSTDKLYDETGDPKARADAATEVTKTLQDAMGEMAAIIQCVQALKDEISKSKPEDESKTIGDLSKDSDGTDFPTADDIATGVEKAYQIPDWFNKAWQTGSKAAEEESGGIFKKIGNFLKSLFGSDETGNLVDPTAITAAIMSSPFEEFAQINLSTVQKNLAAASEAVGTETAEASGGAAAAQSGKEVASSGEADVGAGKAGAEALAKDKDAAKGILDALKGLGSEVAGAVGAALGGKIEDLPPRQQAIASRVLAMYQGGSDGGTPEDALAAAEAAIEDADKEAASAFKNIDTLADLGDQHLGDGGAVTVKALFSDPEVAKLFAHKALRISPRLHENALVTILFEQDEAAAEEGIPLEDLVGAFATAAGPAGKAPDEAAVTAWAADVNDQDLLDKKIAIPGEDEYGLEQDAPVSDEEAKEEQALSDDALKSAAEAAAGKAEAPGVAIATALDNWMGGLSKTSQSSLTAKGRMDSLKDLINTALEDAAKAIEGEVAAAVGMWRGEHEETLMKSRRFAKKNFDSLEQMIPAIASAMLKKTSEGNIRLTRGMVRKSVFKYLDKKYNCEGMLLESNRWEQLAGLRGR